MFAGLGGYASMIAFAAVSMAVVIGGPIGHPVMPRLPKKQIKAVKRAKAAEPMYGWPKSKNPPPKRRLKRNLVTHSRRDRGRHRRASKAAA